jgi:hypothetical protein
MEKVSNNKHIYVSVFICLSSLLGVFLLFFSYISVVMVEIVVWSDGCRL